ncbi:hypothetical protein D7Y09_16970 [bacterium 1XD42-1]|nr:hypothetical protein D7Y09_16970 [bacterium 1XD42-1]
MANQAELIPCVMRVRVGDEYIPHAPLTTASQVLMPDDTTLEDYIAMTEPSELLCQIQHNLNGYPNVLLLEGRYTAGTGGAGDGPAGGEELTQYPCRQTYQDANNLTVFTVKKLAEPGTPTINKISDYVYTLTYSGADSLYIKLLLNI